MFYIAFSGFWGSEYQNIFRLLSPFVVFLSVRIFVKDKKQLGILFWAIFLTYIPTIALSSILIFFDKSIEVVNYYTGLSRHSGLIINAHGLSHLMIFFTFISLYIFLDKIYMKPVYKWMIFFFLLLSYYNIYYSYVRNGYLSIVIFWSIFTFYCEKKYWIFLAFIILIVGVLNYDNLSTIFWQTDEHSINAASSGRLTIWKHNIDLFINQDIFKKICGWGLIEYRSVIGAKNFPASSHNDYLQLLMETGLVGLILYFLILFMLISDAYKITKYKFLKYNYLSSIITFMFISMVTNGWVLRVECGQLFWSFIGGVYILRKEDNKA